MNQIRNAVKIAEAKYPKEDGWRLFGVFDQSSCHMAFDDDVLNASCMIASPGGAQPLTLTTPMAHLCVDTGGSAQRQ